MIGRSSSRSIVLLASLGVGIATSAPGQAELPVAMQVELETLLGVPVEVLTPRDLPNRFREQVVREAMPV